MTCRYFLGYFGNATALAIVQWLHEFVRSFYGGPPEIKTGAITMNTRFSSRITFGALVVITAMLSTPTLAFGQSSADMSSKKVTLEADNGDIRFTLKQLF